MSKSIIKFGISRVRGVDSWDFRVMFPVLGGIATGKRAAGGRGIIGF